MRSILAKVTLTFEDCEQGISLTIDSDPPLPHRDNLSSQDTDLTEAQHAALSMVQMMNQVHGMEEASEEPTVEEVAEAVQKPKKCCGGGGCSKSPKPQEKHACQRHVNPDEACKREV
jgi:hypothetical protein